MAQARTEQEDRRAWNHTSALLAALINTHRDAKKRAVTPDELNPYKGKRSGGGKSIPITADNIEDLKRLVPKK